MHRILLGVLTLVLVTNNLEACSLAPNSSWKLSEDKITKQTEYIWEGRVESIIKDESLFKIRGLVTATYRLTLLKNIKGKLNKTGTVIELGPYQYDSSKKIVSYGKDCKRLVRLEEGKSYRVLHEAFSPYSFVEIIKKLED